MQVLTSLTGFPEWLPAGQLVEQRVLAHLCRVFELHGFGPLDTRHVEPLARLSRGGEVEKELYAVVRHQGPSDAVAKLGLHFDLTVPFARYVDENAGRLPFPFKRYQTQKVWRGERPQDGRYREFRQVDIDVVGQGELPSHFESELPAVMAEALAGLPLPPLRMRLNNRELAEGFFEAIDVAEPVTALRAIDKLDRHGPTVVEDELLAAGLSASQAQLCLGLAAITTPDGSFVERVRALGVQGDRLDAGLAQLALVLGDLQALAPGLAEADLGVARGLDYYTGTVYETLMVGHEALGSVCSGGRYDDLVGGAKKYPGVGLSLGLTRLLARLLGDDSLAVSRPTPTCVLVALPDDARRRDCRALAQALRARGIPADVAPTASKYGKQIKHAEARGIPYVWFPGDDGASDEVKDLRSGTQVPADAASWEPAAGDRTVELALPQG